MTKDPKETKTTTSNEKVSYGYSVNLSSKTGNEKKEATPLSDNVEKGKTGAQKLAKVATAKVTADKVNPNSAKIDQKEDLTLKVKEMRENFSLVVLGKATQLVFNAVGAKFLQWTDSFLAFVALRKDIEGKDDVVTKSRSPILFGLGVIFVTFFIGGIWAFFAPLDSASGARGFVVVSSKKQLIQHREGGVIEAIYVREGEEVQAGQDLLKINDKSIKAQLNAAKNHKDVLEKNLELVTKQLEGIKSLHQQNFASKETLVNAQLREAQILNQISDLDGRISAYEEVLDHALIKSPVAGTVNQLQVNTIGGTVHQGMTLMTIIPKNDDLVIEAFVNPNDIESIHVGSPVKVRITAFKSRTTAPMDGIVTFVSQDVVEPPQNRMSQESVLFQQGMMMYKVMISVNKSQLRKISKYKDLDLHPGMIADVMIVTGERTMLQYLLDPITNTFWHAFIEK